MINTAINNTKKTIMTLFQDNVPHGLWLGPLTFLVQINDLITECRVHKFVDDTTLTKTLLTRPHTSKLHTCIEQLKAWTDNNHMVINTNKMKEMLPGPLSKSSLDELFTGQAKAKHVTGFKLLGIYIVCFMFRLAHSFWNMALLYATILINLLTYNISELATNS